MLSIFGRNKEILVDLPDPVRGGVGAEVESGLIEQVENGAGRRWWGTGAPGPGVCVCVNMGEEGGSFCFG